jgi:hypothetical protein
VTGRSGRTIVRVLDIDSVPDVTGTLGGTMGKPTIALPSIEGCL